MGLRLPAWRSGSAAGDGGAPRSLTRTRGRLCPGPIATERRTATAPDRADVGRCCSTRASTGANQQAAAMFLHLCDAPPANRHAWRPRGFPVRRPLGWGRRLGRSTGLGRVPQFRGCTKAWHAAPFIGPSLGSRVCDSSARGSASVLPVDPTRTFRKKGRLPPPSFPDHPATRNTHTDTHKHTHTHTHTHTNKTSRPPPQQKGGNTNRKRTVPPPRLIFGN